MSDAREQVVFIGGATHEVTVGDVGGKGHSLLVMAEAGLPVPRGAVLTTTFFAPWLQAVLASSAWTAFADAEHDAWRVLCPQLVRQCATLELDATQRAALDLVRARLAAGDQARFAVRSSSPEEDLESASFAGGYETRLGVREPDLVSAVKHCFASLFAERVFAYKRERDLPLLSPRIAVVVQQQVDAEVAGVGFSLNPLTNDHDEAVIDANWGLGESVVAGLAAPDHFVVDRVSGEVIEYSVGAKQVSIVLDADGGTVEREGNAERTLSEPQLRELVAVLGRIEALLERPVDIEWAFADGRLHLLQARPITTYVPLPPAMMTAPGERRRLYADAALAKGLTINGPISVLGLDWTTEVLYADLLGRLAGVHDFTPAGGMVFAAGCRLYMNLSNMMRLGAGPKSMAKGAAPTDALLAATLANVDAKRYRAPKRPPWLLSLLLSLPRALWAMRGLLWNTMWMFLTPRRALRKYQRKVKAFQAEITGSLDFELSPRAFARKYSDRSVVQLFDVQLPAVFAGLLFPRLAIPSKSEDDRALAAKLDLGLPGNLVVEQGIALFRLAKRLDPNTLDDLDRLTARVRAREMPAEFLAEWDAFMERFGCRGPLEMDPASPRYADSPRIALRQMSFMAGQGGFDPEATHRHNVQQRERAGGELLRRCGWLRRVLLRRLLLRRELFGGARDNPKHQMVMIVQAVRQRMLVEGRRLADARRLDAAEHVFDLTFRDLEAAANDPDLDLRALRAERTRFARRLQHVTEFPQVIDSRGRILRPASRATQPGELVGTSVSMGKALGTVKVLRTHDAKTIEPGDVLVAYTTDPGWTPLFINAAAVVLEVGGSLQHGAVVARELGKPCVVGIDRVVARLRDGQRVEVDGTAGVVRLPDR